MINCQGRKGPGKLCYYSGMRIMGDERILGGNNFVESVLDKANEEHEKRTIATAKGFSLEKILDIVALIF